MHRRAPERVLRPQVDLRSGSEAGSYLRLLDLVYHSTLGLRVIKMMKRKSTCPSGFRVQGAPERVTRFQVNLKYHKHQYAIITDDTKTSFIWRVTRSQVNLPLTVQG